ncbi:DUF2971 domain-containing protein [Acinetobacter brisouii]
MNYTIADLKQLIQESYNSVYQDANFYYLYKHFSIDKELATLGVFSNKNLLYKNPNHFNDPFDCQFTLKPDFKNLTYQEANQLLGRNFTKSYFNKKKKSIIEKITSHKAFSIWEESVKNSFAVTCLNASPLNILMWSHYADHHKGFMLEFKYPKINGRFDHLPLPVKYTDVFPILNYPYDLNKESYYTNPEGVSELLIKRYLHKAPCWSYENEFRLAVNLPDYRCSNIVFKEYDPDLLSSVIFGAKISDDHRTAICTALLKFNQKYNTNILSYNAKLSNEKYEILVPRHPILN